MHFMDKSSENLGVSHQMKHCNEFDAPYFQQINEQERYFKTAFLSNYISGQYFAYKFPVS